MTFLDIWRSWDQNNAKCPYSLTLCECMLCCSDKGVKNSCKIMPYVDRIGLRVQYNAMCEKVRYILRKTMVSCIAVDSRFSIIMVCAKLLKNYICCSMKHSLEKKQHASSYLYDLKTEFLYIDVSIILGMVVDGKTLIST